MADSKIQYLKGKDNTDLLLCAIDESNNNDGPPIDINDRNYKISAINSNFFEPKEFSSYKNAEDPAVMLKRHSLQGIM